MHLKTCYTYDSKITWKSSLDDLHKNNLRSRNWNKNIMNKEHVICSHMYHANGVSNFEMRLEVPSQQLGNLIRNFQVNYLEYWNITLVNLNDFQVDS